MPKRRALSVALALGAGLAPGAARAWLCPEPKLRVWSVPGPLDVAPLNTHVFVLVGTAANAAEEGAFVPPAEAQSYDPAHLELGLEDRTSTPIAVDTRKLTEAYELVPRAPLAPRTLHYVIMRDGKRPWIRVGQFTTGEARDLTPPVGPTVVDGLAAYGTRTELVGSPHSTYDWRSLELALGGVTDDQTARPALVLGLWSRPGDGAIDYTHPADVYLFDGDFTDPRAENWGRHVTTCRGEPRAPGCPYLSLDRGLCGDLTGPLARLDHDPVRIGARTFDLAGNASTPSELVLHPVRHPPSATHEDVECNEATRRATPLWVLPRPRQTAPTNTRVRVFVDEAVPDGGDSGDRLGAGAEDFTLATRDGAAVACEFRALAGAPGLVSVYECLPERELDANRDFTVSRKGTAIATFHTGAGADHEPPRLGKLGSPRFRFGPNGCTPWLARLEVDLPHGHDAALFAVWVGDAAGHLDYGAAPRAYVQPEGDTLILGSPRDRLSPTFDVGSVVVPGRSRSLRLGLRPLDLAGNQGPALELDVDLTSAR